MVYDDWDTSPIYDPVLDDIFAEDPPGFITNFGHHQLPIYQEALNTWPAKDDFELKEVSHDGSSAFCSLWYFGKEWDLSSFWKHFNKIKAQHATDH